MADEHLLLLQAGQADKSKVGPRPECSMSTVAASSVVAPSNCREIGGRVVIDELPERVGLLPGEAELVAHHLLDSLDALFAIASRAPVRQP